FSILHKIVLRLIPRSIESELDYSTCGLNAQDSSGRTPVAWAAARSDEVALKALIRYGADVNLPDSQGRSPLHHAQTPGCIDVLTNAGADVHARDAFGHTPLHRVCRGIGSLALLERLVLAGVDINAVDHSGETALANAAFNKHVECVAYLVECGADINIAAKSGNAPVHLALISDVPDALMILLSAGAIYDCTNSAGRTMLHYAAEIGSAETLGTLQACNLEDIDVNIRDIDGQTAEDLLEGRSDEDDEPGFKATFRQLLTSITGAGDETATKAPEIPSPSPAV
ncbi:MAG: hypothetical protein Q9183_004442, partial [Haloplaca sp. 2 TL-2023]